MTLRILLSDNDPLARRILRDTLQRAEINVVAEAATGREAVELARYYAPDVVVMAHTPPGMDGIETMRRLDTSMRVVILSPTQDDELGLHALRAGAAGYLAKDIDLDALPRALRGVVAGEAAISRRLAMKLIDRYRALPVGGVGLRPVRSRLTDREWEVLDLLASGVDTADIADGLVLSTETVRSHVKSLYRKLDVNSREQAIRAASRMRQSAGLAA